MCFSINDVETVDVAGAEKRVLQAIRDVSNGTLNDAEVKVLTEGLLGNLLEYYELLKHGAVIDAGTLAFNTDIELTKFYDVEYIVDAMNKVNW